MPRERYFEGGDEVTYEGDDVSRRSVETSFKNRIYRHADAERVQKLLEENQILVLEAEMGAGKSSVLRSVTEGYSESELLFYNGHNFGNDPNATEKLRHLLSTVTEKTRLLVVDSADYLFQSKKYIRSGAKNYHENCKERMDLIFDFAKSNPNVKLIMTSHDDNWKKMRGDAELMQYFQDRFPDAAYMRPSIEVSPTTVVRYLEHEEDLSREEAWFVTELWKNPVAANYLNEIGFLKRMRGEFDGLALLKTPRIISQIFRKFPSLKKRLKTMFSKERSNHEETEWIKAYVDAAVTTDYQSIFFPIISATRGSKREAIWGVVEPLDGTDKVPPDEVSF